MVFLGPSTTCIPHVATLAHCRSRAVEEEGTWQENRGRMSFLWSRGAPVGLNASLFLLPTHTLAQDSRSRRPEWL